MTLTLNIYDKGKVVKTYTSSNLMLSTGNCEDIIKAVDIERLISGNMNETEMGKEIIKLVVVSFNKFYPFMQDIFEGLSEEEYKKTNMVEVAKVVIDVVKYTINELFNIGGNSKN